MPALAFYWWAALFPAPAPVTRADLDVFPRPAYVIGCLEMSRAHAAWLRGRGELCPRQAGAWEAAALACDEAREPWDSLWCAQPWPEGQTVAWDFARPSLERLRKRIGEDAYYHGRMPPLIPPWTLEERD